MTPPSSSAARRISVFRVAIWIVGVVLFLFLILLWLVFSRNLAFLEVPYRLLAGWFIHTVKAFPFLFGSWKPFLLPLGCMLLATWLIHRFAVWWHSTKNMEGRWPFKHTIRGVMLLLLGAAAAIALSGVVHQMVWLSQGQWTQTNHRRELTEAVSKMRQLTLWVVEFQQENGRYPYSMDELQTLLNLRHYDNRLTWMEPHYGGVQEHFILLHPGRKTPLSAGEPLIVSPWIAKEDKIVVGYADLSVRSEAGANFAQILLSRKAVVKSAENHG